MIFPNSLTRNGSFEFWKTKQIRSVKGCIIVCYRWYLTVISWTFVMVINFTVRTSKSMIGAHCESSISLVHAWRLQEPPLQMKSPFVRRRRLVSISFVQNNSLFEALFQCYQQVRFVITRSPSNASRMDTGGSVIADISPGKRSTKRDWNLRTKWYMNTYISKLWSSLLEIAWRSLKIFG